MARIVFMGTPGFAVPTLAALIAHHQVVAVVTQPDRPAGRKQQIRQSPVKRLAEEHGIAVLQPVRIRRPDAIAGLKQFPADFFVVTAFGQILPQEVLDLPTYGPINVHASLLPRWRGAAPIQAAIRAGDETTGITIMRMEAGLDTGPILSQRAVPIHPDDTGATLHDRLAPIGAALLIETLPDILNGRIRARPQDDTLATHAPAIDKTEGQIDWSLPAISIERMVRAFTPWPGTFSHWKGRQLKILEAALAPGRAEAGAVIQHNNRIAVGTADDLLILERVQLEGRNAMSAVDFARGQADFIGSTLST